MQKMDYAQIEEFCLDWQMGYVPKEELVSDFRKNGWSFNKFKDAAMSMNWYVESMNSIEKQLSH